MATVSLKDESGSVYYESRTFTQWGSLNRLPDRTSKAKFPWIVGGDTCFWKAGSKGTLTTYTKNTSDPSANPSKSVDNDPFTGYPPVERVHGRISVQVFVTDDVVEGVPTMKHTPALKVVRTYSDASRTSLVSVAKYDFARQSRRRGKQRLQARLRSLVEYGASGEASRYRVWFYADSRDWHRWTHSETLVRASAVDGQWVIGTGSVYWVCIHHSRYRQDEIVPLKNGGSKLSLLAGFDSVNFVAVDGGDMMINDGPCQTRTFGLKGETDVDAGRTYVMTNVGSVKEEAILTETETFQGGWHYNDGEEDVPPQWNPETGDDDIAKMTSLNSGKDSEGVFTRMVAIKSPSTEDEYSGITLETRKTLSRSGVPVSCRILNIGGEYHETQGWTEDTEVTTWESFFSSDGLLSSRRSTDHTCAGGVTQSEREYFFRGRIPESQKVTEYVYEGPSTSPHQTTYIEHHYTENGEYVGSSAAVPASSLLAEEQDKTSPRTEGGRELEFIRGSIEAFAAMERGPFKSMASFRISAAVQHVIDEESSISSEQVDSLVDNVRPYVVKLSGSLTSAQNAWLNFALTAIQCRYGCLKTAEEQMAFMERCIDVVESPDLRTSLVENCAVSMWALVNVNKAVSCADGYTFSQDLVLSAAGVVYRGCQDIMESDDVLQDSVDIMRLSLKRAAPERIGDEERVAVRVVNLALGRMGSSKRISSMEDDSAEAMAARGVFESCRRKVVSAQTWSWATSDARLVSRKNTTLNPDRWTYSCRLPVDCIGCVSLWSGRRLDTWEGMVRFEVNGRRLFCDQPDPWLRYVRDASLVDWPELALDALAWEVAADLTMPLTVKPELATRLFQMAQLSMERAYAHDRNQQVSDVDPDGKLITCRE